MAKLTPEDLRDILIELQKFTQVRLPPILGQIGDKRERYWKLMTREGRKNALPGERPELVLSSDLLTKKQAQTKRGPKL